MPNATTSDARAGWEMFRTSGFTAELEHINRNLVSAGHRAVSQRTYSHYRNLATAGYTRYVSINRFDVARAARPYEGVGASSRYSFLAASAGVQITFPRGRKLIEAVGKLTDVGDTGVVVRFDAPETVAALTRNRPRIGEDAGLDFFEPRHHVNGRIIDFETSELAVRVEIEFGRLQSVSEYVGAKELPTIELGIQLSESGSMSDSVDVVGRQLYYVFELMESARAFSNEARRLGSSVDYSPVVKVARIRRDSRLMIAFVTTVIVAAITKPATMLLGVAHKYHMVREQKYSANEQSANADIARAKANYEQKKSEVLIEILQEVRDRISGISEAGLLKLERIAERDILNSVDSLSVQAVDGATIAEVDDDVAQ
ncbi:MAG: hypothetical protein O3B95_08020 [Chloroflexi bacterium]|nr:hypothetical protein [Chloroflexota bacterium]